MAFTAFLYLGCTADRKDKTVNQQVKDSVNNKLITDSTQLKDEANDSVLLADASDNDYFEERLKPIRENFKRINSIAKWTEIKTKEIRETTEGGEAKFYYLNGMLEKIAEHQFGETFQILKEYYLSGGKLSFVYEKTYQYNRPMYFDSIHKKSSKDIESFDYDKSQIFETRYYFENGKLILIATMPDNGSPYADDYLVHKNNLLNTNFQNLLKLSAAK